MRGPVVTDSTCLIGLERIDRLDLLPALFEPVVAPPAVHDEFGSHVDWLRLKAPADKALVATLRLLVDEGEAETIALACERRWQVILDDRRARSVARRIGIAVIGTVGVLVRAKHSGILASLKPLLEDLERRGFFLSASLKKGSSEKIVG